MRRGFTLLELNVAAGLLLLLLSLCARLFWPSLRFVLVGGARAEMQQRAVLVMQKLGADLQSTAPCGVSLGSGVLAVQPISEVTPDPRLVFSTSLVGWLWRGAELRRLVWPASPLPLDADLPVRLDAAALAGLDGSAGSAQKTLLIEGVSEFRVASSASGDDVASPLSVRLTVERSYGSKTESFTLDRRFVLRNGF